VQSAMRHSVKQHSGPSPAVSRGGARQQMPATRFIEYDGLCSTCLNASGCLFLRDPKKPIVCCEEFLGSQPAPRSSASKPKPPAPRSPGARGSGSTNLIGLCRNCESRRTCAFPRPEGGVWHCEEYL
jgi:hypothetical protein